MSYQKYQIYNKLDLEQFETDLGLISVRTSWDLKRREDECLSKPEYKELTEEETIRILEGESRKIHDPINHVLNMDRCREKHKGFPI